MIPNVGPDNALNAFSPQGVIELDGIPIIKYKNLPQQCACALYMINKHIQWHESKDKDYESNARRFIRDFYLMKHASNVFDDSEKYRLSKIEILKRSFLWIDSKERTFYNNKINAFCKLPECFQGPEDETLPLRYRHRGVFERQVALINDFHKQDFEQLRSYWSDKTKHLKTGYFWRKTFKHFGHKPDDTCGKLAIFTFGIPYPVSAFISSVCSKILLCFFDFFDSFTL